MTNVSSGQMPPSGISPTAAQAPPGDMSFRAPRTGAAAAPTVRGGVAADEETRRQDPSSVSSRGAQE